MSYAYLDIWPSPDNYESPSIWTHQVCKIKKMPTLIFWTIFSHPDHCGKGRFWLLCNWFFLRSFQLIRHAYFSIIVIKRIKMVWIIKCPDITYYLNSNKFAKSKKCLLWFFGRYLAITEIDFFLGLSNKFVIDNTLMINISCPSKHTIFEMQLQEKIIPHDLIFCYNLF